MVASTLRMLGVEASGSSARCIGHLVFCYVLVYLLVWVQNSIVTARRALELHVQEMVILVWAAIAMHSPYHYYHYGSLKNRPSVGTEITLVPDRVSNLLCVILF